jgi:drug/metabolite transporter (DMT)-like permease
LVGVTAAVLGAVVLSAFLHASWNALLKREVDTEAAAAGVFVVCGFAAALVALAAHAGFSGPAPLVWSLASGVFEGGYIITLALAFGRAPLGAVYTVSRGGAIVFVWPLSMALLGEPVTASSVGGAVLVLGGLALTGLGAGLSGASGAGLVLAGVSAANIAGYHLCYKYALAGGGAPTAVFAVSIGVAVPMNLLRLGRSGRARLAALVRARRWPIVVAGLISCASFLVFLYALARAGAGAVFTLRNTSVLFAQLLAWAIGERPTRAGIAGAVVVAAGAVILG